MAEQPIVVDDGERRVMIGVYDFDRNIFGKSVKESKHLFKKMDAWGIDDDYFTNVLKPRNALIVIHDTENKTVYRVRAEVYAKHGKHYHFKDRKTGRTDHRAQIFLSRRYFESATIAMLKEVNK